jgi:hypothetical protein
MLMTFNCAGRRNCRETYKANRAMKYVIRKTPTKQTVPNSPRLLPASGSLRRVINTPKHVLRELWLNWQRVLRGFIYFERPESTSLRLPEA